VKATHAYTINGRTSLQLKGSEGSQEAELRRLVHFLDGVKRCSLSLWAIPDGKEFDDVDVNTYPQEYVQAAGGGDRMTAEIREIRDGQPHQWVIGRLGEDDAGQEVIEWDDGISTPVASNEVLGADEVADLFVNYYKTGTVPTSYSLREIQLQQPPG
jgi:hypothetical protein